MIKPITTTKRVFATTILEAESIIKELKNNSTAEIKKHSITKKVKRTKEDEFEYYLVDFTLEENNLKDIIA